jgi:hypothetical protein
VSGEEFRDSEVLAHLKEEGGTGELELENVTVVVDLLLANDFELGLDGFGVFSRHLLEVGRVAELADCRLLRDVESLQEVIESNH